MLAITLIVTGGLTSCRTHHDINVPYTRHHRDRTQHTKQGGDTDNWKTLDITLSKGDNERLYDELKQWLGTPYRYAASTRGQGTDCSGLVMEVINAVYRVKLERNSARMFEVNCREIGKHRLKEADLVFFNNGRSGRINHVGIYLKDGYFVHASSSRGVIVSRLDEDYYTTHFQCAGRIRALE